MPLNNPADSTAAIGKLAANSGVDIGDVDVTSVIPGTGATNLGKAVDAVSGATDSGVAPLAVRDDALAALTPVEGDYVPLRTDANGALWTHDDALDAALAGSELQVDVVAALPAGTNAIGKLVANSGVDIGDVDVTSVIPGTGATNLGKAVDAVAGATDSGVASLAVRDDALAALTPIEGDYVPLRTDANGALWTHDDALDAALSGSELQVDVVASLPAGTNAIGKLAANSGVDIGDVDVLSIAAGDNNIGNVDIVTLPAGNLGQQAMAASLSTVPANNITDATYIGDIKFGESLPAGTAAIGKLAANSGVDIGDVDVTSVTFEATDDGAITLGTQKLVPMGALADETSSDPVDEGDIGIPRMTLSRILWTGLRAKNSTSADKELLASPAGRMDCAISNGAAGGDGIGNNISYAFTNADASNQLAVAPLVYNESTWDRQRGNTQGTLLASAARTATTSSADQTNYNARGVRVRINVSSITDTPSITVAVEEKDSISGNYVAILTSAAIATTGQKTTLVVYPGVAAAANVKADDPLPRTWRVTVTHGDADSITYSVDYAYIL